ncbi:MAG: mucoidy inhibitor MuiA family protein [Deltaproteobacteria bacterium]|nr:mucoidy inhibitor MuiA family protein [Deltaproteobacteria bacterium]
MSQQRIELEGNVPVRRVVVMEDRAEATRTGSIDLPKGDVRVRIAGVAPVAADKTVHARFASASIRVDDVRVSRRAVVAKAERPDAWQKAEAELKAIERRREELLEQRGTALGEVESAHAVAKLALSEIAEDVSHGRFSGTALAELGPVLDRARAASKRRVELDQLIETLGMKKAQLIALRARASSAEHDFVASLEIDAYVGQAGPHELSVDYVVPNACWRPEYVARLVDGPPASISIEALGCVWQRTGEDWKNVELCFSTERPSLGTAPPLLREDMLFAQKKSPPVVEVREQRVFTAGLGADAALSDEPLGIDDGGSIVSLVAKVKTDVPSDGRPHRVLIFELMSEADVQLVAMPELAPAVFEKSVQTNTSAFPLLAGPVELVRSSGNVGRSSILYVAPKERFTLGFGPDPELRLSRDVETIEKSGLLGQSVTATHRVRVRLSNLGDQPKELVVDQRVPVSEIPGVEVHVEDSMTTGGAKADERGFVSFPVRLNPYERRTIELGYTVKRPADLAGF